MKKVKFGVLGAGPRTETLLKTYAACDLVEVTSICDIADDLAGNCAKAYEDAGGKKGVKIYKDYEDMMKHRGFEFTLPTVLTALGAAVCHFTAVYMLIKSMTSGSYSVSVIIINMNFCVPIICSALFLREKVSLLQLFGVLLLVFMIVIINIDFKKPKQNVAENVAPPKSLKERSAT